MDCELVTVGTELLLGFTVDTNAAEIGRMLAVAGVRITRRATVPDEPALVRQAVEDALERCETVIVTGGLGPTKDDLTKQVVAELFGRRLVRDESRLAALEERFRKFGHGTMPESNRRQADVPEGATVLDNRWGTAPGLWLEDERGRLAVLLPGVPKEMRALMEHEVVPRLVQKLEGTDAPTHGRTEVIRSQVLRTTGISESALADLVGDPARHLPLGVTLAWLPSLDGVDLRLTAWRLPPDQADSALATAAQAIRPILGTRCYGEDETDLAAVVLEALERESARLATAESCTGGLVGSRITAVPGSSRVYLGGVVAYDNEVKLGFLGVSAEAVAEHGAVSETVARQMAAGAAQSLGAEAAVAVTGIAGPDGGTADKPVGTVWIAVQWREVVRAFTHVFPGGRAEIRYRAAQAALDYLRRVVTGAL